LVHSTDFPHLTDTTTFRLGCGLIRAPLEGAGGGGLMLLILGVIFMGANSEDNKNGTNNKD
jgi:hypothetical protein